MDRANQIPDPAQDKAAARAALAVRPGLRLVSTGLRLAAPVAASDPQWDGPFMDLLDWLEIPLEPVAAARAPGLRKMADWARPAPTPATAPRFAPWQAISPVAWQHGGAPELPRADWAASYLYDSGIGSAARGGVIDVKLMSPHPAACAAPEPGLPPLPRPAVTRAMIRAARAEGRKRLAIIVAAGQRNALARQLLLAERELTREGLELDILAVEQAIVGLLAARPRWDGLIVMPDLRSIAFTLLAEASRIRGPWPMLWHDAQGPVLVASEALVEAGARLPLDAVVLGQALALSLRHAGKLAAAHRLHEAAARLRESGVVTAARGSPAPYVTTLDDAAFVKMLCAGPGAATRAVPSWRALGDTPASGTGGDPVRLSLVASLPQTPR